MQNQEQSNLLHTKILYRYGRIFICFGIFMNIIILVDGHKEAIRFAGVTCIFGGFLLTMTAMYGSWLQKRMLNELDQVCEENLYKFYILKYILITSN